jgi:hypothetical protein
MALYRGASRLISLVFRYLERDLAIRRLNQPVMVTGPRQAEVEPRPDLALHQARHPRLDTLLVKRAPP